MSHHGFDAILRFGDENLHQGQETRRSQTQLPRVLRHDLDFYRLLTFVKILSSVAARSRYNAASFHVENKATVAISKSCDDATASTLDFHHPEPNIISISAPIIRRRIARR